MIESELFLSSQSEALSLRRGDALGFRSAADALGSLLASGLTNRTWGAGWLTIHRWCIQQADQARASLRPGRDLEGAALRRLAYAWIRPFEFTRVAQRIRVEASVTLLNSWQFFGRRAVERNKAACVLERFRFQVGEAVEVKEDEAGLAPEDARQPEWAVAVARRRMERLRLALSVTAPSWGECGGAMAGGHGQEGRRGGPRRPPSQMPRAVPGCSGVKQRQGVNRSRPLVPRVES